MPYREVMGLPMKVFWHLSGLVPRVRADEQKDLLEITTSAQNPEAAVALREALSNIAPEPIKLSGRAMAEMSDVRDEAGFEELRNLA